jgi:hypothetical protein
VVASLVAMSYCPDWRRGLTTQTGSAVWGTRYTAGTSERTNSKTELMGAGVKDIYERKAKEAFESVWDENVDKTRVNL